MFELLWTLGIWDFSGFLDVWMFGFVCDFGIFGIWVFW